MTFQASCTRQPEHTSPVDDEAVRCLVLGLKEIEPAPLLCGVYFLLHGSSIVYIGKSTDIIVRITRHERDGLMLFDSVRYIELPEHALHERERGLICRIRPKHNSLRNMKSCLHAIER